MADAKAGTLVNLASEEYSKAIDFDGLGVDILQTTFLQRTGGKDKFISVPCQACPRVDGSLDGEHRPRTIKDLRGFNLEGIVATPRRATMRCSSSRVLRPPSEPVEPAW